MRHSGEQARLINAQTSPWRTNHHRRRVLDFHADHRGWPAGLGCGRDGGIGSLRDRVVLHTDNMLIDDVDAPGSCRP